MRWRRDMSGRGWRQAAMLAGVVLLAAGFGMGVARSASLEIFQRDRITIETAKGGHELEVEIARTQGQRAQGLMFRKMLAADAGMLFLYDEDREIRMWMKNTFLPLDMFFLAADGRIVRIVERTVPMSKTVISSGEPVRAVLEVNAGTAARLAVKPGDFVRYQAFH